MTSLSDESKVFWPSSLRTLIPIVGLYWITIALFPASERAAISIKSHIGILALWMSTAQFFRWYSRIEIGPDFIVGRPFIGFRIKLPLAQVRAEESKIKTLSWVYQITLKHKLGNIKIDPTQFSKRDQKEIRKSLGFCN